MLGYIPTTLTASCDRGEYAKFDGAIPIKASKCITCAKGFYQSISARGQEEDCHTKTQYIYRFLCIH